MRAWPGTRTVDERHDQWPLSRAQMATPARLALMPVWDKTLRPLTEGGETSVEWVSVSTSRSTFSSRITILAVANLHVLEGPDLPLEFQVPIRQQRFFKGTEGVAAIGTGRLGYKGAESGVGPAGGEKKLTIR